MNAYIFMLQNTQSIQLIRSIHPYLFNKQCHQRDVLFCLFSCYCVVVQFVWLDVGVQFLPLHLNRLRVQITVTML